MIPPGDSEGLNLKDHGAMIALALLAVNCFIWYTFTTLRGESPAPAPVNQTTREFYEAERTGLHSLESTDIETTAEKLDRIRRRDAASRQTP